MGQQGERMWKGIDVYWNYAKTAIYTYYCDQNLQATRLYKGYCAVSPGNYETKITTVPFTDQMQNYSKGIQTNNSSQKCMTIYSTRQLRC